MIRDYLNDEHSMLQNISVSRMKINLTISLKLKYTLHEVYQKRDY